MKTIETTFEPSDAEKSAIGNVELRGTDKEVQTLLNKIGELTGTIISDNYVIGEYVRVRDKRCYEFCEILLVGIGSIEVADKEGKALIISMTSAQIMGERRVLSLVGERVQKDIVVGDLVLLDDGLIYECNNVTTTYPFALVKGNNYKHSVLIARFESDDEVILPHGLVANVTRYLPNGMVVTSNNNTSDEFYEESELEPWDPVTAVQRYAASFGMKVNVDVS